MDDRRCERRERPLGIRGRLTLTARLTDYSAPGSIGPAKRLKVILSSERLLGPTSVSLPLSLFLRLLLCPVHCVLFAPAALSITRAPCPCRTRSALYPHYTLSLSLLQRSPSSVCSSAYPTACAVPSIRRRNRVSHAHLRLPRMCNSARRCVQGTTDPSGDNVVVVTQGSSKLVLVTRHSSGSSVRRHMKRQVTVVVELGNGVGVATRA